MAVSSLSVTYTSVDMIRATMPEIGSLSNVTSTSLAHVIGKAEAEINARINKLYNVPISVGVPLLTTLSTDLAIYYVMSRRPLVNPQSKSDPWLQKFKEVRELLDKIASGEIQLLDDNGTAVGQNTSIMQFHSNTKDYLPTFDEREPEEWRVSKDKLDDLDAAHDD